MLAWLNNIPIHLLEVPKVSGAWNVVCYEYVTEHKPKTVRINKAVDHFNVSAVLYGKAAGLKKEMILKALEEDCCEFRHPFFKEKLILVPVRYDISPYSGASNAFSLEMEFLEKGTKKVG